MTLADFRHTLLAIDDSPVNLSLLADMLEDEYTVLTACGGAEGLRLAAQHLPDLILLDVMMPGVDGYEVLRQLKANPLTAGITVIFLTGLADPEEEARGLRLGGSDFITKPFNIEVVRARVAAHLRLTRLLGRLENLASVDGLTGIANRRKFDQVLDSEFSRAQRNRHPLSVALVDIDFFKQYNDCYGHAAGDETLHAVAQALHDGMKRPGDLAARYGGEEFALILPETRLENAAEFVQLLCDKVAGLAIKHGCSAAADRVTVSIGVASIEDHSATGMREPLQLVQQADERLYRAKAQGRNRVVAG